MSASESSSKIQDELAMLFDRQMSMTMAPTPTPPRNDNYEAIPVAPQPISQPNLSYSITQHYNHSAHVASSAPTASNMQANNQADSMALMVQDIHAVLHADAAQQKRLIQTWQFYSTPQSSTSLDLEMNDDSMAEFVEYHGEHAEPYMTSGYGVEAVEAQNTTTPTPAVEPSTGKPYDSSTDPVYRGAQEWWEMPQTSSMESQYGLYEERSRHYSNSNSTWQPQRCFH
ncbi:hypothetical protein N7509_002156 [Penicillium cosmopolitanum]|uniref:Uncharacterized protein n=1 Tax=Penicillium cosmopolitanum TaxID=1131564 RepID=A0A9W9W8G4_9EURO|nr:uncharacterized protein N7509_002156 [Penicillium cosmopolitanum]KAJ5408273.1 hypothetical protein N7509_002156 [Penicillium cosmopolitanum]